MRKRTVTIILGKKLRHIRLWKGITQTEMLQLVMPDGIEGHRARVSQWEKGLRQPPIDAQIIYAQIAGIPLENLLIEEQNLPAHLLVEHSQFKNQKVKMTNAKKRTSIQPGGQSKAPQDVMSELKQIVIPSFEDDAPLQSEKPGADTHKNATLTPAANAENSKGNLTEVAATAATENQPQYHEELLQLPINIGADESVEPMTLVMPVETVNGLHDTRLKLQLVTPRQYRPQIALGGIVNLCVRVVLDDYRRRGAESLIVKQTALMIRQLNEPTNEPSNQLSNL